MAHPTEIKNLSMATTPGYEQSNPYAEFGAGLEYLIRGG